VRDAVGGTRLTGAQRSALLWVCLLVGVNQLGFGAIVPVVALYADGFGVGEAAIGLAIAVYGAARFGTNVPAGRFADRRGRKALIALGGGATLAGNLVCAVAPSYSVFLLGRVISGAGAAMVITGAQTVVADVSDVGNRGRLMAIYQGVFLFSVGIGPLPGGLLATEFGLAAPFAANALISMVTTGLALWKLPETVSMRASEDRQPFISVRAQLALIRAIPGFAAVGFVSFAMFFSRTGALFNVVPLDASERLGLGPDRIGLALGLVSLMGLGLAWPSGLLADRFGRKTVIVPATAAAGAAMLLFGLADAWPGFVAAATVWAAAVGIGGSVPAAYASDLAPRGMTAATLGAYRTVADLGYIVGPLVLGAIAGMLGASAAYVVVAALSITAAIAFGIAAPETVRRNAAIEERSQTRY
jgi:MFS family permease